MVRKLLLAAALAVLASTASLADVVLQSPPIGDLTIPGLYPQAPSAPQAATAAGAGPATASVNSLMVVITTASLTTAAAAQYVLTVTDSYVAAGDEVFVSQQYNGTTGYPVVTSVAPTNGQVVITVTNTHATAALNGTLALSVYVLKNAAPQ